MNNDDKLCDLRLSRRDVGRLLGVVSERRRKQERGIKKFADNFDPAKGQNIVEGFDAFTRLEQVLTEAMNDPPDNSRSAGRHPA